MVIGSQLGVTGSQVVPIDSLLGLLTASESRLMIGSELPLLMGPEIVQFIDSESVLLIGSDFRLLAGSELGRSIASQYGLLDGSEFRLLICSKLVLMTGSVSDSQAGSESEP